MQPDAATDRAPLTLAESGFLLLVAAACAGEIGALTWVLARTLLAGSL